VLWSIRLDPYSKNAHALLKRASQAFVGLDTSGLSLKYILQTLLYHFCPADSVADILVSVASSATER
jgi:hypothetical protein